MNTNWEIIVSRRGWFSKLGSWLEYAGGLKTAKKKDLKISNTKPNNMGTRGDARGQWTQGDTTTWGDTTIWGDTKRHEGGKRAQKGARGGEGAQGGARGRKGAQGGARGRKGAQGGARGRKGTQGGVRGVRGRKGVQGPGAQGGARAGGARGARGRKFYRPWEVGRVYHSIFHLDQHRHPHAVTTTWYLHWGRGVTNIGIM